jgi:hypothetical protein
MSEPEISICWIVGLEGELRNRTRDDGAHGWAVTRLMSYDSENVYSVSGAPLIDTLNEIFAGYVSSSGSLLIPVPGVEVTSVKGVGCKEPVDARRSRD